MIQAHKALEMATHACTEGGTIVLLAACREGMGHPTFLRWFAEKDSGTLQARLKDGYEVNGQTAWSLMVKVERYRVYLVSELSGEDVRRMRMIPKRSLDDALEAVEYEAHGYILPRGGAILPVLEPT